MEAASNKNQNQLPVIVKDKANAKKSVCGIMKDNTVDVIQKLESEMPSVFQGYSELYVRYLHFVQDIFGTCSLAEKQYFDKMDVDQNALKIYDDYLKSAANIFKSQIDLSADFVKRHNQFRISSIDSWDKYTHTCIDMYAKFLAGSLKKDK